MKKLIIGLAQMAHFIVAHRKMSFAVRSVQLTPFCSRSSNCIQLCKSYITRVIAIAMLLTPGLAFAANNDVQMGTSDTQFSVNGATVTIGGSASSTVETIVVDSTTFDLTFAAGSTVTMTAPEINVVSMTTVQQTTSSCSNGVTTLVINASIAGSATIRPGTTACATAVASSGGGTITGLIGGGGGGGGGGTVSAPTILPKSPVASVAAAAAAVTSAPAPTPAPSTPSSSGVNFGSDFGIGDKGANVIALQTFLEIKGFLVMPPGVPKGQFGGLTKKALQAYQKSMGISPTGYVGPKTRLALNAGGVAPTATVPSATTPTTSGLTVTGSFTRDLEVGYEGADVQQLQVFLNTHGFVIATSGSGSAGNETTRFGGLTKKALAKFQAANGIKPAVGYFGPKTRSIVNGMLK